MRGQQKDIIVGRSARPRRDLNLGMYILNVRQWRISSQSAGIWNELCIRQCLDSKVVYEVRFAQLRMGDLSKRQLKYGAVPGSLMPNELR